MAIAAGLALMLVLSNREAPTPTGLPVINNIETYQKEMAEASREAEPLFIAFDQGREITEAQKATLRRCALLFDTLNTLKPDKAGPFLDAGRAYLAIGDYETAENRIQQCLNNSKLQNTDIAKDGVADAERLMSMIRGQQGKWPEAYELADEAVNGNPNLSLNYVARASAAVQLNRIEQAKADVAKALATDPSNNRALQLRMLLDQAETPKTP